MTFFSFFNAPPTGRSKGVDSGELDPICLISNRRFPSFAMFFAALRSRSWRAPQAHVQERSFNSSASFFLPHAPQSLLEGKKRSIVRRSFPRHAALYSNMERKRCKLNSWIERARRWSCIIPLTLRSSMATTWFSSSNELTMACR